ncbi:hypothetical protein JCM10213_008135 [Rhodosporidiobolus nylandii]
MATPSQSDPLSDPGPVPHPSLVDPAAVPSSSSSSSTPAKSYQRSAPAASSSTGAPVEAQYPPIEPSGTLLLAHPLSARPSSLVVLIGGGAVAASRLYHLLCAGPGKIRLIAPASGVCDETRYRLREVEEGRLPAGIKTEVEWIDREYAGPEDLEGATMVLTAIDSPGLSSEICRFCRKEKIPVNVADVPPECDFYFGSVLRRGALSVMVSTNGKGPRVAARLRRRLEKALPGDAGKAIENVGLLRAGLRRVEGGKDKEVIERRMEWMSRVSDRWSLAQLGEMDDRMRREVLEGWEGGEAKGYWDVNCSSYFGFGRVAALLARWGAGTCPVDRDPDGRAGRCPFVLSMSGFVAGAVIASAGWAVWAHRR